MREGLQVVELERDYKAVAGHQSCTGSQTTYFPPQWVYTRIIHYASHKELFLKKKPDKRHSKNKSCIPNAKFIDCVLEKSFTDLFMRIYVHIYEELFSKT